MIKSNSCRAIVYGLHSDSYVSQYFLHFILENKAIIDGKAALVRYCMDECAGSNRFNSGTVLYPLPSKIVNGHNRKFYFRKHG